MRRFHLLAATFWGLVASANASATSFAPQSSAMREPVFAFAAEPVSSGELAATVGGAAEPSGLRRHRLLVEPNMISYIQQVDGIAGTVMDTWWAQTGAALIASNVLGARQ